MDEFRELLGVVVARVGHDLREAALEVVLDCLDVVHRLALDLGEFGDVVTVELLHDVAQRLLLAVVQRAHAVEDAGVGEVDEPLDLDVHAHPVERGLRQVVDERGDGAAVAAVEGSEGDGGLGVGEAAHAPIVPNDEPRTRVASEAHPHGGVSACGPAAGATPPGP